MKYNNNNKAFKSQTSWGRLELKPSRSNHYPRFITRIIYAAIIINIKLNSNISDGEHDTAIGTLSNKSP